MALISLLQRICLSFIFFCFRHAEKLYIHPEFHQDPALVNFEKIVPKRRKRAASEASAATAAVVASLPHLEGNVEAAVAVDSEKLEVLTERLQKFLAATSDHRPDVAHWNKDGDAFFLPLRHHDVNDFLLPYFHGIGTSIFIF